MQLHETMKVGLARCAMRFGERPDGLCRVPSIQRLSSNFTQDFRDVIDYEHRFGEEGLASIEYLQLMKDLNTRHRSSMVEIAKGVSEFYENFQLLPVAMGGQSSFRSASSSSFARSSWSSTSVRAVSSSALIEATGENAIRDLEEALDEFFTDRLTMRLMISHIIALSCDRRTAARGLSAGEKVGVVNMNIMPVGVLAQAYGAARKLCLRHFDAAPELLVNGVPHEEYVAQAAQQSQSIPYVRPNLVYILQEVIKNAAKASVDWARRNNAAETDLSKVEIPPLRAVISDDMWSQERSFKLADNGTGMTRNALSKAFCYSYSSVQGKPQNSQDIMEAQKEVPLAGFGFGLPISRVYARYFSGDIGLNSVPGRGADVHVYL